MVCVAIALKPFNLLFALDTDERSCADGAFARLSTVSGNLQMDKTARWKRFGPPSFVRHGARAIVIALVVITIYIFIRLLVYPQIFGF